MDNQNNDQTKNWYGDDLNYDHKKIKLEVYSARPVEDKYLIEIAEILGKKYNFEPSPVVNIVDPDLIGGVKVVFDTKVIDGTIKGKLENIKKNMSKEGFED